MQISLDQSQVTTYPPVQWFGPHGAPDEVVPLGAPDNHHIPVAFRHRAGQVRGYGERPHGADDLYFLYPPALQPGQRPLRDAELLRELHFADGYMPSARYVALISALGAGGAITELRWVQTSVANIRRQIRGGLFLQHWYIADPWAYCGGSRDTHYVHDPMDDEDPDDGDFDPGPQTRSECDLCGSSFWPGAGWSSTDDWKGTGMSCCGCQSDSCDSIESIAPGPDVNHSRRTALAYDPRCVVGGVAVGDNLQWQGIRCLIAYFASTGARKADVALDAGVTFGLRHLSMWNATWEIRDVVVSSPSAE